MQSSSADNAESGNDAEAELWVSSVALCVKATKKYLNTAEAKEEELPRIKFEAEEKVYLLGYAASEKKGWGCSETESEDLGTFPLDHVYISTNTAKDLELIERGFDVVVLPQDAFPTGTKSFHGAEDVIEFLSTSYNSAFLSAGGAKQKLLNAMQAKQKRRMAKATTTSPAPAGSTNSTDSDPKASQVSSTLQKSLSTNDVALMRSKPPPPSAIQNPTSPRSKGSQLIMAMNPSSIKDHDPKEKEQEDGGDEDEENDEDEEEALNNDPKNQKEGDFQRLAEQIAKRLVSADVGIREMRLLQFIQMMGMSSGTHVLINVEDELHNIRESRKERLDYFAQKVDRIASGNKIDLLEELRKNSPGSSTLKTHQRTPTPDRSPISAHTRTSSKGQAAGEKAPSPVVEKKVATSPTPSPATKSRKEQINYGSYNDPKVIEMFKEKPSKTIKWMIDENMIDNSANEVAELLWSCVAFDKVAKGEFLGEPDEFNLNVLALFCERFDFLGLDFDIALRRFLYAFRLPGEAQKIDRIMNAFASQYYKNNPNDVFKNCDAVYVLAFSVIMLNTDAHNPRIENKMTQADFIKNTSKINDGEDLPTDYLSDLYNRIIGNEIKMENPTFPDAVKMGWMWTKGLLGRAGGVGGCSADEKVKSSPLSRVRLGKRKNVGWKKLWFIYCQDGQLLYFEKSTHTQPMGILHVTDEWKSGQCTEEEKNKAREGDRSKLKTVKEAFTFRLMQSSAGDPVFFTVTTKRQMDGWIFAFNRDKVKKK